VVGGLAGGTLTANIGVGLVARVAALQLDTGLVAGTVIVTGTFSITSGIRISQKIWRTGTLGSMVDGVTVCVLTTRSLTTSTYTSIFSAVTGLSRATLTVSITLMSTLHQRISNIGWLTGTDRPVILPNLAVSVAAAGGADFFAGKPAAGAEWVTSSAARTPADSHVILDITVSSLAA